MGGKKCSVCEHPKRKEIDRLLVAGELSQSKIADKYGLNKQAVGRHKRGHLTAQISEAVQDERFNESIDHITRLNGLIEKSEGVYRRALGAEKLSDQIKAIEAQRRIIMSIAELMGDIDSSPTVNITIMNEQYNNMIVVLLDELAVISEPHIMKETTSTVWSG